MPADRNNELDGPVFVTGFQMNCFIIFPDSVIGNTADSGSAFGGSSPPREVI